METTRRTLMKAVTWQVMGIITMTVISYPHTGSLGGAFSLAMTASVSGFVFYLMHEKVWNSVRWGRSSGSLAEKKRVYKKHKPQ